jgi:hypothetical protein
LSREGEPLVTRAPLATAIDEFQRGPLCVYVREHPFGLLPGISNLYCLDADLRLLWLAEWPAVCGPCTRILDTTPLVVTAESTSGMLIHLNAETGRAIGVSHAMAAAG